MLRIIRQIGCLVALIALAGLFGGSPASADIVDTPHFKINGLVIVWGANASANSAARIGTHLNVAPALARPQTPLRQIPQVPVTGHLVPIRDHHLVALTDKRMHFHVASNTAFSIDAELVNSAPLPIDTLRTTTFGLRANIGDGSPFGASSQYPHTAGPDGGIASDVKTLADLTDRRRVFTGNQATAAKKGSIVDQSVRFDITLRADNAPANPPPTDIIFTVFVP